MAKKRALTQLNEKHEEVIVAYQRGLSLSDIGNFYGFSESLIRTLLKQHGVPIRPRGGATKTGDQSPSPA